MSLSARDLPLTQAASARLQVLPATGSTNADLVRHVTADPAGWPHLSVIVTDDQRAGRGRLDRVWKAPAGTALAISVVLRADAVPADARGWIPLMAGAAMTRAVSAQLGEAALSARLKWPNDVLLFDRRRPGDRGRKLCGILAEVVPADPAAVVVGAGVNTTMTAGQLPVDSAVSFRAVAATADADRLIADYVRDLDAQLRALAAAGGDADASGVRAGVAGLCATLGETVSVSLPGGGTLLGAATELDADGRLVVVDAAGGATPVGAGDVVHVR